MSAITLLSDRLTNAETPEDLKAIWQEFLGDNGTIKSAVKGLSKLDPEERRIQGPILQEELRNAQALFSERELELQNSGLEKELIKQKEVLDLSSPKVGHLHPITRTIREMNELFIALGFSIMDGPEIEKDEYCFQRLNVPLDHPARDMQDTLYISEPDILLRTQTSSIEARTLANFKPPFKIVSPGRVYRNEKVNKSNHFIFHHYQGVVVLEKTSLKELFGTFTHLFQSMYGKEVVVRYRNKYYPEVEPGVGPDMQCFNCKGKGCPLCKGVGWLEMGGAGMIHPNVLRMAGLDPEKWMGFAFGLGLDRWVMAKYNITDIRTLLGGNLAYNYFTNETAV